jgi:hypothetical protein
MHLGAERTGVLHICLSEVPLVTSGLKAAVRRQQAAGTYPYAQRAHQPYRQRLGRTQRRLSPNCTQTICRTVFEWPTRCAMYSIGIPALDSSETNCGSPRSVHIPPLLPGPTRCKPTATLGSGRSASRPLTVSLATWRPTAVDAGDTGQSCTPRVSAPSTTRLVPLTRLAMGLARKTTGAATCS